MQISIVFLVNVTREITNNLVFPFRSPSFISNTMRKIKV